MTPGYLERQLAQQRDVYGVDPTALSGEQRAQYVRENYAAAVKELGEYLDTFEWKPWHRGLAGHEMGRSLSARQHQAEEIADVLKFVLNLALVEGLTDEELERTFDYKARRNAERHRGSRMLS